MRRLWAAAACAAVLGACGTGGTSIEAARREGAARRQGKEAASVKPPSKANPRLTARVGLIVATNSGTWAKALNSPAVTGVTVLFVQPGGPADKAGVKRGDVITQVDADTSPNADLAVVQLRARPEEKRVLKVSRPAGSNATITVEALKPGAVTLTNLYNPLIQRTPNDPVLYFLRAQAPERTYDEVLADVEKAIQLLPSFVEAVSLRGEVRWNRASAEGDAVLKEELRDKAVEDWRLALGLDPNNTRVLVSYSQALAQRNNAASAKREAEKARKLDPMFPRAYYAHAQANFVLGRYGEAAGPARHAIDLDPFDVRYYRLLALIFQRLDRKADCERTVEAIVDLIDDASAKSNLRAVCETPTNAP